MIVTPIHKKATSKRPRIIAITTLQKQKQKRLPERVSLALDQAEEWSMASIFIVRHSIEKAKEHQVPLYFDFIDFKTAFDTKCRKALWKMLLAIGVDP